MEAPCAIAMTPSANAIEEVEGSRLIVQRRSPSETAQADTIPSESPAMKDLLSCAMAVTGAFKDLVNEDRSERRTLLFISTLDPQISMSYRRRTLSDKYSTNGCGEG